MVSPYQPDKNEKIAGETAVKVGVSAFVNIAAVIVAASLVFSTYSFIDQTSLQRTYLL